MKKSLLFAVCVLTTAGIVKSQVTQINSNKSLHVTIPLNNVQTVLVSELDSTLWVTEGNAESTEQLSASIKFEGYGGLLAGKFIFRGWTAATGSEIFTTDGTPGNITLVKDIYAGAISSTPSDFTLLNGIVYFTAVTTAEGRELWKTDGTNAGTALVKDIATGATSSNGENNFNLFTNGSYLLFAAESAASQGVELWKSDGTNAGTVLLKEIYSGSDSSMPHSFIKYNNMVLFLAKDAASGEELWKTDGNTANTVLVKDINPGPAGCTSIELFPGFAFPIIFGTHTFNNKVYFTATNGASGGQVWGTDGTAANTTLVKDIVSGIGFASVLLFDAVDVPGKFIFPVSDGTTRSELWQSDGSTAGTSLFKAFSPANPGETPYIALNYTFQNGGISQSLFNGNTFFFVGGTTANGTELWKSDGTVANTVMVKDINPGAANGIDFAGNISYLYTSTAFFFAANNGTNGNELWRTDGTAANTEMVQDINTDAADANPQLSIVNNNKIIFSATDGDDVVRTDLFVVDGNFVPLPVKLAGFSVAKQNDDALLQWSTAQEINSNKFTVQRSYDAVHFENIGTVQAAGNSDSKQTYSFTDVNINSRGKSIIYYRLLTTDNDGRMEYSRVISLKLKTVNWNVQLIGNPVQENITIAVTGAEGKMMVVIKDMAGKPVYSNSLPVINTRLTIPAAALPRGVYVVVVSNGEEKKIVRFVK